MPHSDAVFYVMSGTGNTYRAGCWMAEIVQQKGGTAEVVMIEDAEPENQLDLTPAPLTGFLFPTHGFMPPWSMIKFLFKLPRVRKVPAICVATRGCIRLDEVSIPGIAGIATFLAALILFIKGYRIKAIFSLDMPSNFINFHSGLHPSSVETITEKTRHRVDRLMPRILSGKRIFFTLNNLWEAFWGVLLIWAIPLFPIIYLLIGRIFMGKLMFSNNTCIGCGLCAKSCPNTAIKMRGMGKKKRPYWTFHCETCLRCMGYCPKQAVEAGHSFAILAIFATSIPAVIFLMAWLRGIFPVVPIVLGYWAGKFLNLIYFFPALFISYWLFWQMIRIPFINKLFTVTTFTHYYRRYHQPETKVTHMRSKHVE